MSFPIRCNRSLKLTDKFEVILNDDQRPSRQYWVYPDTDYVDCETDCLYVSWEDVVKFLMCLWKQEWRMSHRQYKTVRPKTWWSVFFTNSQDKNGAMKNPSIAGKNGEGNHSAIDLYQMTRHNLLLIGAGSPQPPNFGAFSVHIFVVTHGHMATIQRTRSKAFDRYAEVYIV